MKKAKTPKHCVNCDALHHLEWSSSLCYICTVHEEKKRLIDKMAEEFSNVHSLTSKKDQLKVQYDKPKKQVWVLQSAPNCFYCQEKIPHTKDDHYLAVSKFKKGKCGTTVEVRKFTQADHSKYRDHELLTKLEEIEATKYMPKKIDEKVFVEWWQDEGVKQVYKNIKKGYSTP